MTEKETLYGKNPEELAALCAELGLPRFAARQIARWLYVRGTEDPMRMTDLAATARERLAARFAPALSAPERVSVSADGTKKYLFRTRRGHYVESAYIPDGERATLCVSSQAGCRMGCRFCATGRQGLQESLPAAEILNQIVSLPERDRLTNLVFMGMGRSTTRTNCCGRSPSSPRSGASAGRPRASPSPRRASCRSCGGFWTPRRSIWP